MHQTAVINVVGLTGALLGEHTPHLVALAKDGVQLPIQTVTPAVTCSVQSTFLTGLVPSGHGIVANGWYFRNLAQVWFWQQSNHLVAGEKVWETARRRDPNVTCAKMFWWYNMYSSADFSVTPRPMYPADGRKIPDIYSHPTALGDRLRGEIGEFPFFHFWGPKADILSSNWIAEAGMRVFDWQSPTLTLIYLPHLDYNLQRLGPDQPAIRKDLNAIDQVCGKLINHFRESGTRVIVLSEYGISPVDGAVHINRILREAGLIRVRLELGLEVLDAGASEAFAVADHQVAHVYVRDPGKTADIKTLLEKVPGIEQVLDETGKKAIGLDHPRSGELVAIAQANKWFSYYYWLDDAVAPDFARTVDIHRKPGYDPLELFMDPKIRLPLLKMGTILLKKWLGFRYLFDVIPLDASLVKGSHGRISENLRHAPVFISSEKGLVRDELVPATRVKQLMLDHLFAE
ncbi:alkaline phosphatase family protein [Acidobacteria bacterium AH-259-O06]|nr:alkaline phosphatase family protein [Acidobacteria bacterium AH-259-O06]